MAGSLELKQGEAKPIEFTITSDGVPVDVSTGTFSLIVKLNKTDSSPLFSKSDGDFDKTNAANGVVTVNFSATDTDQTPRGDYILELTVVMSAYHIDKSVDFPFAIIRSL